MRQDKKSDIYIVVNRENGTDLLCPAGLDEDRQGTDDETNVCFEKDVSERYAGNITIRES